MLKLNAQLLITLVRKNNTTRVKYTWNGIFGFTVPNFEVIINPCIAINKNWANVIK
jgi:hypothetical protein